MDKDDEDYDKFDGYDDEDDKRDADDPTRVCRHWVGLHENSNSCRMSTVNESAG